VKIQKRSQLLIEKGASVNTLATDNETPLHKAAEHRKAETVTLLIEKEAYVNALGSDIETPCK
jgi:ankyrin repeat protein